MQLWGRGAVVVLPKCPPECDCSVWKGRFANGPFLKLLVPKGETEELNSDVWIKQYFLNFYFILFSWKIIFCNMADTRIYLRVMGSQSELPSRRCLFKVCSGRCCSWPRSGAVTQKLQFLSGCCCSPEEVLGFLCKACSLALECLTLDFLAWLGV